MKHDSVHTLIVWLASILLMAAVTACVEPISPSVWDQDEPVTLTLQVNAPSASLLTKAPDGQVGSQEPESALHDLWIWLFNGDQSAVTPYHKTSFKSNSDKITVTLPASLIKNDVPSLNIYALGNGPSVDFSNDKNPTPTTLLQKVISGDGATGFGKAFVTPAVMEAKGLPMTYSGTIDISYLKYGFNENQLSFVRTKAQEVPESNYVLNSGDGLAVSETQASFLGSKSAIRTWKELDDLLNPKIELLRAVSKLRFLFARETDLEKTVTIESIQLDDGVMPVKSYLFPGSFDENWENGYNWSGNPLLANDDFLKVDLPMNLRSDSQVKDSYSGKSPSEMTAQEYERFLARRWGNQQGLKTCYLRESKRSIKGVIRYTVNKGLSGEKSDQVIFDLSSISPDGFLRNLSNLVYVYFDSGKRVLVVDVSVLPWSYNPEDVDVSQDDSNTLKVDQDGYLIVDPLNTTIDYKNPLVIDGNKVYLVPLPEAPKQVTGHMIVYAPVGGTLRINPVVKVGNLSSFKLTVKGKTTQEMDPAKGYLECPIDRNYDKGRIYVYISRADNDATAGHALELSFQAVTKDGRVINADSEIIDDRFRFVIPTTTPTP